MGEILVVDAEAGVREALRRALELAGHRVQLAEDDRQASKLLLRGGIDVALFEVFLRGDNGLELLRWTRRHAPGVEVILTGLGLPPSTTLTLLEEGAYGLLAKPLDVHLTVATMSKALEARRLKLERAALEELLRLRLPRPAALVAEEDASWLEPLSLAAATELPVAIHGEPGLEPTALAARLHEQSRRAAQLFLVIPCEALASARAGLAAVLERVNDGTLAFEDPQRLPRALQVELAEVAARRALRFPGGREVPFLARPALCLSQPWREAVEAGGLAPELAEACGQVTVAIPPLRERPEALAPLLDLVMAREAPHRRLSEDARERLLSYAWPGNIAELRGLARWLGRGAEPVVSPADLPAAVQGPGEVEGPADASLNLAEVERRHIQRVLARHQGNKMRTARALDINVKTLYNKIRAYGLDA